MNDGWIKMFRKLQEWEWYNNSYMVHIFIHLILSANHKDQKWKGILIKRGQVLTGLNELHKSTGISVRSIRTCLSRLHKTGEIDRQSDNRFSIITICNYEEYQNKDELFDKQIDKQATSKRQASDNKQECKEVKEEKYCAKFELFWTAFDDKRGKKEASKSWSEIKLTDELFAKIINAAKRYAEQRPSLLAKKSTPKMAQGWLTDERWDDELPRKKVTPIQGRWGAL
jgi:predicted transcriptional regulator